MPESHVQEMLASKRSSLGLLTGAKGSPVLFADIARRLRRLAIEPETEMARAEVDAVLNCPWWGLRVLAIKVIASWGGPANKASLIERIDRDQPDGGLHSKQVGWWVTERSAAMRAVAPLLDESDSAWVLTTAHENVQAQFAFWSRTERIPDDVFLKWLSTQLRSSRGLLRVRLTNMVGRRKTLSNYLALLQIFAADDCHQVVESAGKWLTEANGRESGRPDLGRDRL